MPLRMRIRLRIRIPRRITRHRILLIPLAAARRVLPMKREVARQARLAHRVRPVRDAHPARLAHPARQTHPARLGRPQQQASPLPLRRPLCPKRVMVPLRARQWQCLLPARVCLRWRISCGAGVHSSLHSDSFGARRMIAGLLFSSYGFDEWKFLAGLILRDDVRALRLR